MIKRVLTTTKITKVSNNPCNKCEYFRYIINGNHITENCMLFFDLVPRQTDKSANRIDSCPSSEYSLEPELSESMRNDETKCGSNGKYFIRRIED
jgi:hypothetical protein